MYSLVLMTALSTSPSTAEFNGFFRDLFASRGGCGGCAGSTSRAAGCGGCGGGLFNGRIRSFFRFDGGCGGSCVGGCTGRAALASCYGSSCTGGMMYAPQVPACDGCPPPCDGCPPSAGGTYQPYLPPGVAPFGGPLPADPYPGQGVPFAPPTTAPPPSVRDSPQARYGPPDGSGRATVVVRLPADARLYAEDRPLNLDAATRTFVTPPLPAGREFTYRFRAEYDRNGRTVSETKRLVVRPNGTMAVEFEDLTVARGPAAEPPTKTAALTPAVVPIPMPAAGPAPAKITVTLPPDGTLYIDNRKDERADRVREYTTPPLPPGKEFAYWMTVETGAAGQKEYVYQKVVCKAGESVPVDFTRGQPDRRASAR